jgi:hypothetical protein
MIKLSYFTVIAFFLILFVSFFAGCIQSHTESQSPTDVFNNVNSLFESGTSRITPLVSSNFTSANLSAIRLNSTIAKENFSEAINLLNKIPPKELSNKDQTNLQAMKIVIDANIKISELLVSKFSNVGDEYQNLMYSPALEFEINSEHPYYYIINASGMKSNLSIIKSDISSLKLSINEDFNKLNHTDLSPNILHLYNESEDRLIIFNKNVNNSIIYLENACLKRCFGGKVLGAECGCYPQCGEKYCDNGWECCNEKCYGYCDKGTERATDCSCKVRALPTINIPYGPQPTIDLSFQKPIPTSPFDFPTPPTPRH